MASRQWALGLAAVAAIQVSGVEAARELPEHRPGELVVKLSKGQNTTSSLQSVLRTLQARLGVQSVLDSKEVVGTTQFQTIRLAQDSQLAEAISILNQNPAVEYAEPNFIYRMFDDAPQAALPREVPNDPQMDRLWGMSDIGINAFPVWQSGKTGSRNIKVAIIDTGIDFNHPDLQANMLVNTAESGDFAHDGIDNDGNGFTDDTYGWDFANGRANGLDDQGHGTHCAGTIGGVGNNGVGVAGVNWQVSMIPVKFLDSRGSGSLSNAVSAIHYATNMHVNIMSNSWGGGGFSQALYDVINEARQAGILFIAAAGNDHRDNDARPSYPASYDASNIVSVAAYANNGAISTFSNYGARSVHVAAPGTAIYSTYKGNEYRSLSGTSMATPHVSGIAALLLSVEGGLTPEAVRSRLILTSRKNEALTGKSVSDGQVDLVRVLANQTN